MENHRYTSAWSLLIVSTLQKASAPIVTGVSIYAIVKALGLPFTSEYAALTLSAMLLSIIFIKDGISERTKVRIFGGHITTIITGWIIVVGTLLLIAYATKQSAHFSRLALFTWFILNPFLILFVRWGLQEVMLKLMDLLGSHRRVIIAGITDLSRQLAENIATDERLGMKLIGFFDDRSPERSGALKHGEYLGTLADLSDYVNEHRIDVIYIALPIKHMARTKVLLDQLQDTTTSVYYVPDIFVFDLIQSRVDNIHGVPVLSLLESPFFFGYNGALKRLSDICISMMIISLTLPLWLAIALAVKLSSPGPVIFKQRRYGLSGEEITVYKFRTMTVMEDGDDIKQATKDDDRFTPIGRWLRRRSLDELPQFINVLQGRMSIVGPRPHAVSHNELYRKLIKGYMIRHKVMPGITGWAQVNGCRGETEKVEQMQDRIKFDLEYLRHWSLWFDIKIVLRTIGVVINDDNAH